ncbi:MAG: YhjD/YihY/BrkB family envelope integrity protein [Solirubrobacteraceae bacterium]
MDALAPIRAFDRFQRRHKAIGIPIAVLKKFADDGAGNAAALIAYFGFFSLFPLLLLFVTVLGFVLQGDMSAQQSVLHSALKQFPFIGDSLKSTSSLHGSPIALVVGIVGAALSGLGVTLAAENAFNAVYAVPHKERASFLSGRLRGLKLLVVFGVLQLISTVVSGVVSGGFGGVGLAIAGIVVSLLLNLLLFFAVFRLLTADTIPTRGLWPGIVLASVLWEILQSAGGAYVGHVTKGGGAYAQFGAVIAMLVWLYLGARVVVYSAEINTVLTRELWPRSIMDPPTAADRRTRAALAKVEERDDKQTVDVTFHPDLKETSHPGSPPYSVAPRPAPGEDASPAPWDGGPAPAPGGDTGRAPGNVPPAPTASAVPRREASPAPPDLAPRRSAWTPRGPWTRPGGRGE